MIPVLANIIVEATPQKVVLGFSDNKYVKYEISIDNQSYSSSDNHIVIDGLMPGTTYKAQVQAYKEGSLYPSNAV